MNNYGILGIDWGLSKIGVAVANTETSLATGLTTFRNDEQLLENLEKIVEEYDVKLVVIGIPTRNAFDPTGASNSGAESKRGVAYDGEQLGARLVKKFGLQVAYHNERYTTKMARANLVEQGLHHLDRHDDREAARLILQSWLDAQK